MATLFLDFENGNDNYAGTSFSLLAQGTNGRITTATFSSAGASFPNNGSLIGQYLSIFNGTIYAVYNITAWVSSTSLTIAAISGGTALANQTVDRQYYIGGRWKSISTGAGGVRTQPGDTIRIMGSPAPTSLGQNGVWTSQASQATKVVTGATNTAPISITCTAHGYSTGDTVVVTGFSTNTAANGTWEITVTGVNTFTLDGSAGNGSAAGGSAARLRNNTRVKLASAVTQNIACTGPGRAAWTAVPGSVVSTSLNTSITKEHYASDTIVINNTFTTGLAAYWPTGTLNLSGYQQVSFWIQQTSGSLLVSGSVDLRLCSDATGNTAVNIISIPSIPASGRWMPVTVDLGTSLGSNINSIALYVNTDFSGQTFVLSNIIACKASSAADSLTLTSLIGKNTTGETFWGIQSINGTRVMLDADTNATPISTTVRGYYGTSETVTTWKRETIKLGPTASISTPVQTINNLGTEGSPFTYSGGWDRTAMTTQNLETWVDGVNGVGFAFYALNLSWLSMNGIAGVRFGRLIDFSGLQSIGMNLSLIAANNNTTTGAISTALSGRLDIRAMCANGAAPYATSTYGNQVVNLGNVYSNGATIGGLRTSLYSLITLNSYNNFGTGLVLSSLTGPGGKIINSTFGANNNNISLATSTGQNQALVYCYNCLFEDTAEVQIVTSGTECYIYSQQHDQTANNHKIFNQGMLISSAVDHTKTAGGISWKIQPTDTVSWYSLRPVTLSLAKVACAANSLVTVKAWMRRDNTGLTMRLVCKGGQIAGVTSDVVDAMTAAADTWAEQTITFTPTEVGVVEITAEAWGGTTFSGWVDDMTISQA